MGLQFSDARKLIEYIRQNKPEKTVMCSIDMCLVHVSEFTSFFQKTCTWNLSIKTVVTCAECESYLSRMAAMKRNAEVFRLKFWKCRSNVIKKLEKG